MAVKEKFQDMMVKVGFKRAQQRVSIIKELMSDPENFKLEASIEGDEIIFVVKKKEEA